jgi:hypothetical protein
MIGCSKIVHESNNTFSYSWGTDMTSTRQGLDDWGSIQTSTRDLSLQRPDRLWVPPSILFNLYRGGEGSTFPVIKRPGSKVGHQLNLEPRSRIMELYIHFPLRLYGVMLIQLRTGITLSATYVERHMLLMLESNRLSYFIGLVQTFNSLFNCRAGSVLN